MQYIDCYINPITRLVTYPASTTIVQKDTNTEVLRFHFSLEAEHDLEDDSIRVMVLKAGETRAFNAENVRVETNDGGDEELVFEHTITTYETAEPGQIAVSICGNQVSGNVITEAWHTLNMTFQISGAAHTDSDEGEDTPETAASNAEKIAALQTLVGAVTSGRPIPVDLKSKMVDTDAIYLYTGNETGEQTNYWYYHNGTSWVPGAEYGSMTVDDTLSVTGAAADAKVTGDAISGLNGRLDELEQTGGSGANVPTEVRQALYRLLNNNAFSSSAGFASDVAVLQSWAMEITEITLNQSAISISGASTSQLTAVTVPAGGLVTWSSSNPAVATVSSTGLVTGVGNGTAKITASCGGKKAVCTVTVTGFATLTGITATYTQSGSVYATDDLDDLKSDLVVTGTYSDSTTKSLTDYTLSGTLASGTSTITAHYGGFTATFNVTVSSAPPLYTLYQGTVAMTSGNSLTLSNGNHCAAVVADSGRMAYVDQSKGAAGAPQNLKTTIFTLSPSDEWEFRIKNIEFTSNSSAENRFNVWFYNLDSSTDCSSGQIYYSDTTAGTIEDVTVTGTAEASITVTSVRFYFHRACEMEYDWEFYVNGVRYF